MPNRFMPVGLPATGANDAQYYVPNSPHAPLGFNMSQAMVPASPQHFAFPPQSTSFDKWWQDAPWNPVGKDQSGAPNQLESAQPYPHPHSLRQFPGSDSGYGSIGGIKLNGTHGSACGESLLDQRTETSSHVGIHDLGFPQALVPGPGVPVGTHSRQIHAPNLFECRMCGLKLKTNSEYRKHEHQHTKPFKCDVPGCTRGEGFSTANDLERHKNSKHPHVKPHGIRWQCTLGDCPRKKKNPFSRPDNFRAHLTRIHNVEVTDALMEKNRVSVNFMPTNAVIPDMVWPSPSARKGLAAEPRDNLVVAAPDHFALSPGSSFVPDDARTPTDGTTSMASSSPNGGDDASTCGIEDPLAGVHRNYAQVQALQEQTDESESRHWVDPARTMQPNVQDDVGLQVPLLDEHTPSQQAEDRMEGLSSKSVSADIRRDHCEEADTRGKEQSDIREMLLKCEQRGDLHKLIESLGYTKPGGETKPAMAGSEEEDAQSQTSGPRSYQCPFCPKTCRRRCDLKKHEKRHTKPYGCTFGQCAKRFGSKNDWKRHELAQHTRTDMWKCDQCDAVHDKLPSHQMHLHEAHNVPQDSLDTRADGNHLGGLSSGQFWCGFCRSTIKFQQSPPCQNERFDHIDDHYSGRNELARKKFDDWQNLGAFSASDAAAGAQRVGLPSADCTQSSSSNGSATGSDNDETCAVSTSRGKRKQRSEIWRESKRHRFSLPTESTDALGDIRLFCCQCGDLMPQFSSDSCTECEHKSCSLCAKGQC